METQEKREQKLPFPPPEPLAAGDSNQLTRGYLDSFLIAYRHVGAVPPDLHWSFLGERFSTPVMAGGMAAMVPGLHEGGTTALAQGAKGAGAVFWSGYVPDEEFAAACATGARAIRIIKPLRDMQAVLAAIRHDEACGAFAFAMDIDHGLDENGRFFPAVPGAYGTLCPKTAEDLSAMVQSTRLPFIAKGVLNPDDAKLCVQAGAKALLLSHHKGEYPFAVPPLMILPEIRAAVGPDVPLLVDCGIQTGCDVFKALALGADGVCVARPLIRPFREEGAAGVEHKLRQLTAELAGVMGKTASPDLWHLHRDTLRRKNW